jgi:IclR family transcriptional regulator, KDG regulon repressor
MKKPKSSSVIVKAIQILDTFSQVERPIGVTELATLTGLNVSTAYRIANEFAKHGYLQKERKRGKYTVGLKFLKFKSILINKLDIREVAYPFMYKLRAVTGESVNLAIIDGGEAVYIEHIESNRMLRTFTIRGNRVPLYCTGVGKVFCAYMDKEEMRHLVTGPLKKLTENTITDLPAFEKELAKIKLEGLAMDNGEMEIDVRCIAAPVFDATGITVASVSISGPYTRLSEARLKELKPIVKNYAMEISHAMGFDNSFSDNHISTKSKY